MKLFFALLLFAFPAQARDYNDYVLDAVKQMPAGGKYSKLDDATEALGKSIYNDRGLIAQSPLVASPVYCSGASYQVFVEVIRRLQKEGMQVRNEAIDGLLVNMQPDGTDSWGRWNSNGPGTSRYFYELGLGNNYVRFEDGKPGDFLKMFFNEHIGRRERGHSVVFLGYVKKNGVDYIKYFSSDAPDGRGVYLREKGTVVRVIFSRLQRPDALNNIPAMPKHDEYLASMLVRDGTYEEMLEKIGLK